MAAEAVKSVVDAMAVTAVMAIARGVRVRGLVLDRGLVETAGMVEAATAMVVAAVVDNTEAEVGLLRFPVDLLTAVTAVKLTSAQTAATVANRTTV